MTPAGRCGRSTRRSSLLAPRPCSSTTTGAPSSAPSGAYTSNSSFVICPPSAQRREHVLELRAPRLEPRRQLQLAAQRVRRLVHREARPIRRDLQQQPVRRTEVNALEVHPNHPGRDVRAQRKEGATRCTLL